MIDRDFIRKITTKYQTTSLNVLREYSQNLFLSQLYLQKDSDFMLFKGGTALRLIYNSPRFSEDLDFTAVKMSRLKIENLIQNALVEIEKFGIDIRIDEFSATSGGYIGFMTLAILEEKVSLELNISRRIAGSGKGEVTLISNEFVLPYNLIQLSRRELVGEKIKALLERSKPRDFFDLYFILRSNLLPAQEKRILHRVMDRLRNTEYNFDRELKIFLPKSYHGLIKGFKSTLQREIEKLVK